MDRIIHARLLVDCMLPIYLHCEIPCALSQPYLLSNPFRKQQHLITIALYFGGTTS